MFGRRWHALLLVLLLAGLPVLAHAPAWGSGRLLAPGDGTAVHLPLRMAAWESLERGEVPSWNPWAFSGTPLLAAYQPGVFHPLMVAVTPLAPFAAFQVLVLLSLALAGPLVYAWARRLGAEPVGAAVAGLAFALGPYLVGHLGDTATVVAAPALALALLATEIHLARARATSSLLLAAAVALLVLAGSPEAAGAGALLLAARLAFAAFTSPGNGDAGSGGARSGRLLAAVAAGVLLAAPQVVPTLLALGAGAGRPPDAPAGPATGLAGLVVRYVSHSPAPALALAAVPLVRFHPALAATGGLTLAMAVLMALRGPGSTGGAIPLAFDLALALLAGLSLSEQWRLRTDSPGRRLRVLTSLIALFAVAGLSVATSLTGPLPEALAPPVGLLALAFILYALLGGAARTVVAGVFLLPLATSLLLQPWGRQAWAGAPTSAELVEGTPTRRAIDRILAARRPGRVLSLIERRTPSLDGELASANRGLFAGRRNVDGHDPMVPAARRAVLDGMRTDGTVPRALLETDPGRLELLGVRWVQVPTAALAVPADAHGLGDRLDVTLDPPRPRRFSVPFTRATEVRIASFLADAARVPQGEIVAECVARLASGREIWLPIRAGVHTAEWAWDRPDVQAVVRHERAPILHRFPVRDGFEGHHYLGVLRLPGRFAVVGLRFRAWPGAPPLTLLRAGLRDRHTGLARGVGLASGFLSDEVRLVEIAGTPLVTLFEVRRGVGPARVVSSLRRLPDARRVADVLRSPTRLGVDSAEEALAAEGDVEGVALPPGSRSSEAVLARARRGRLVVRATGPGLLVLSEGWDPGWRAWIDHVPARPLRVNGDRLGVVLPQGVHRVVFHHRARGLGLGLGLALLAAAALGFSLLRETVYARGRGRGPEV
jgi:hypothetical protein